MFGLGFGEILIILVVGIVVVGPRRLPGMMRSAGQWVAKLRRMSTNLRSQSGIDDLIRNEGLEKELADLRSLSRVNVMNTFVAPMLAGPEPAPRPAPPANSASGPRPALAERRDKPVVEVAPIVEAPVAELVPVAPPLREREYPLIGCDAYDALADDVTPYVEPISPDSPAAPLEASS